MGTDEISNIRDRYERRTSVPPWRYSRWNPEVALRLHERQTALTQLLREQGRETLARLDILEVGCGTGANLIEFIQLGAEPNRLTGIELIEERAREAKAVLAPGVRVLVGDAASLNLPESSFDVVCQFTVFSSILDDELQTSVAQTMWHLVRPGGGVLWYDFTFDNPSNRDVRGVPLRRVRELFPEGVVESRRVTLAPPLSRRVVALHPALYGVFNAIPWLRTHVLCWIRKP